DDVAARGRGRRRVGVGHKQRTHGRNLLRPILGATSAAYPGPVTADPPPPQVRLAGTLVGLEGLGAVLFAVVVGLQAHGQSFGSVLGEVGYFVVIGLAVVFVGGALLTGRRGARTPAIVTQLLLLPVVYSLIGPSQQLALGIAAGVYVAATFLLLISERSRTWALAPYSPPEK
ncbi:MAG: hypothetical protein QOH17_2234, partial [Pseudonocardiales bacterium]|nr:hypothetical protein [Pseudonocardiales bacterium]